ncbi:hypothetical protein KASHIRA_02800 [Serratia phage vB_SmaM-Kashira]|nr:hypothetical protein KASHIRA_02800 [Serratia phage vB_SmaM-Kashira]
MKKKYIIFGRMGVDYDWQQVGTVYAEFLDQRMKHYYKTWRQLKTEEITYDRDEG